MRIQAEELLEEVICVDGGIPAVVDQCSVRKAHTDRLDNEKSSTWK
jgi:hypothetical protein